MLGFFEDNPIKKIKLARDLAEYGYETESPSALLSAAEILSEITVQKSENSETHHGNEAKETVGESFSLDAEKILSDAKNLVGKDKTFSAWIKMLEKRLSSSKRGAVKGPDSFAGIVYGNDYSSCSISFEAGNFAQVFVAVPASAELNIEVYDATGKIIASGKENDSIGFTPEKSGAYMIQVKNKNNYNVSYVLYHD